ncbi:PilZ domain-containing protein [Vreelandella populi]|uniref:Pilus assembly protein PilZ n=1 Tax=Vreelandella populi TaxID=2498858 RepID=A0A3S0YYA4_9GAMM|nr:PilZ domain-containing protein [Halomonas populi]RUR42618.1 pilus assembly protein PilZ [Halomonas populi]RUR45779.1 pilus assembly protein PilZ [Halomonas populi]RUR57083.1 pilus assembly protein PilZ [Halomonas populi]
MSVQKAFALNVPDIATLQAAYMPFLERGGIFVPTVTPHALGSQVHLLLTLPGEQQSIEVTGEVAWISPEGAADQRTPGIGVHFSLQNSLLCERIDALLKDQDVQAPSYTL